MSETTQSSTWEIFLKVSAIIGFIVDSVAMVQLLIPVLHFQASFPNVRPPADVVGLPSIIWDTRIADGVLLAIMLYSGAVFYWLLYGVRILTMRNTKIKGMISPLTRKEYLEKHHEPPRLSEDDLLEVRRFAHTDLLTLGLLAIFPFVLLWGRVFLFTVDVQLFYLLIFGLGALACHLLVNRAGNPYTDVVEKFYESIGYFRSDVWSYPLKIFNLIDDIRPTWLQMLGCGLSVILQPFLYLILLIVLILYFEFLLVPECLRPYLQTAFLSFPILFSLILSTSGFAFIVAIPLSVLASLAVPLTWALFLGVAMVLSPAVAWAFS